MEDIIRIDNEFYVLATSPLTDNRTHVLKYGETFSIFNRFGDIESIGLGEQGIYHRGTRYLSRWVLKLANNPPQLLRSTICGANECLTIDAMNVDLSADGIVTVPRGTLHLFRSKFLWDGSCYEHVRVSNYSIEPVEAILNFEFDADYRDIFEVRGVNRERHGRLLPPKFEGSQIVFAYEGLDDVFRQTRIKFSRMPERLADGRVRFRFALPARGELSLYVTASCETQGSPRTALFFDAALRGPAAEVQNARLHRTRITSHDLRFNAWVGRSAADLEMMIRGNPQGAYPYAGVPWFSTVFGRDGMLTAMECLWVDPAIAKSVLTELARTQATEFNPEQEAEPGKIIHEIRHGEMAARKEVPFGCYYGSVDATPLFVMLAGAYLERTGDREFLRGVWTNILAALSWIDRYGDCDGDGFVEYLAKSKRGLVHQGWKDSHDAIFHSDGKIAEGPIALCEVQGYAYAAKRAGAQLAAAFGDTDLAERLTHESHALQAKFDRDFWDDELGTYSLALDGAKKKCRVRTSNPGHCLFSGIASEQHADQVAKSLLADELFCGWGIRTLGSNQARYNPMSYHNGSVWPHDNAIAARGLVRYGFHAEAMEIFSALLDVSEFMELRRLPELFCGFHRRSSSEGPTLYPVACSPQAWSAGAVYLLLEAVLGISLDSHGGRLRFTSRSLPRFLQGLTITNLLLGTSEFDLQISQAHEQLHVEILRQRGDTSVQTES